MGGIMLVSARHEFKTKIIEGLSLVQKDKSDELFLEFWVKSFDSLEENMKEGSKIAARSGWGFATFFTALGIFDVNNLASEDKQDNKLNTKKQMLINYRDFLIKADLLGVKEHMHLLEEAIHALE